MNGKTSKTSKTKKTKKTRSTRNAKPPLTPWEAAQVVVESSGRAAGQEEECWDELF